MAVVGALPGEERQPRSSYVAAAQEERQRARHRDQRSGEPQTASKYSAAVLTVIAFRQGRAVRRPEAANRIALLALDQDASIQMVLISVYWSWAQSDLSRPPKPDSL